MTFRLPVRVYIEDTDAGGIVYYVNYLKYMERARTELLRSLGFEHYTLAEADYQFVVHSMTVNYRQPARMDDLLAVTARVIRAGRAYLLFHQSVSRQSDEQLLVEAEIKIACVDPSTLKPTALPGPIAQALAPRTGA